MPKVDRQVQSLTRGIKRARRFSIGILIAVGLFFATVSSASALTIGLNWDGTYGHLEEVKTSGATVFHVPLQYTAGGGSWQADDTLVEEAWKRGITILPTLERGDNRFLLAGDPNWTTWGSWAREVVERYGINGSFWNGKANPTPITAWEVWNEPNLIENNPQLPSATAKAECKALGQVYYEKLNNCVQPQHYGAFLKYTSEALQAGSIAKTSHGTEVLFGGLYMPGGDPWSNFLSKAYSVPGVASSFSGVAIHPYALASGVSEMSGEIGGIRSELNSLGAGGASLWITEIGWPVGGTEGFPTGGHSVSEAEQASLLTEGFNWIKANASADNIQLAAWFNASDYNVGAHWPGYCGLIRSDGTFRPSWFAFQAEAGVARAPAALVGPGGQQSFYYRGTEGSLWQGIWSGTEWVFFNLGGSMIGDPSPVVTAENQVAVYYRGTDNAIWQATYSNASHKWETFGVATGAASDPSGVGPALPAAFYYQGANRHMWQGIWSGSSWESFDLGGF
jgi:hypothetical protein